MMAGERVKSIKKAIDSLRRAERDAVEKLAAANNPGNRGEFREIHDTLKMLRTALREEESTIVRLLKRLRIFPV